MKIRNLLFLRISAVLAIASNPSVHAAALSWTGGNGTWQVGNTGQWGSAWANNDTATFNGSGGTVTLGGAITTGNAALAFTSGNYSFSAASAQAVTLGNSSITFGNGVTTTLGANATFNRANAWILDGNSDETSTFTLTGGKLDGTTGNASTIREVTVNVNAGGVLENGTSVIVGDSSDGATLNVAGGTVNIESTGGNLIFNNGSVTATVTMTLSSGAITFTNALNSGGLRYGGGATGNTTGVFNLDGGTLTVNKIFKHSSGTINSTFNFNGGTLKALRDNNTDFMTGLTAAVVKVGGAVIDTNGKSITLAQALTPGAPSGGLTKNGLGTLTLSGASTYTGVTDVTTGRLNIAASGSVSSNISVAANATLGGEGSATGSTSFATSGANFVFDSATPGAFTATTLNLGSSVVQLASDSAMSPGNTYLVMVNSGGFTGSPLTNFRSPARGTLAYAGNNLNFTFDGPASIKWKGSDGTNPTFWDNETSSNWDILGVTSKFFPVDDVTFDDTASSFNVAIQGASVRPGSVTFNNTATYTLTGSAIEGTLGITKNGSGIVSLGNANNTYTGTTAINAGTLQVTGGSAIINAGLVTLADVSGATLQVVGSETIGAISGGGASGGNVSIDSAQTLTLGSGTQTHAGTVSGAGSLAIAGAVQTLSGAVSNGGGLTVSAGRVSLGGNNSYTGTTSISSNSGIIVSHANGLGATGTGNETTILGAGSGASGQIGLTGNITTAAEKVVGSGVGHVSPATVDGFTFQQRGMIQSISGNNTFAGNIEINSSGITRFGTQNGAQLTLGGNITRGTGVAGVIQILFRAGDSPGDFITLTSAGHDFDECFVFSASASGNAGLRLGIDNALPVTSTIMGGGSSTTPNCFDLNGYDQTLNGIKTEFNGEGPIQIINLDTVNPSTLTLANTLNRTTSFAAISSNGGTGGVVNVVKTGAFTQGLGAVNTNTGTFSIQGGRLNFLKQVSLYNNDPASWTPAKISVDSGAVLGLYVGGVGEFTGADAETIISNLTSVSNNGLKAGSSLGLHVTSDSAVTTPLTDSTGAGGGAVSLVKSGNGKLSMTATNTYSGNTTIDAGILALDAENTSNQGSTVSIATSASLDLNFAGSDTVDKLFINGVQQAAGVYEAIGNPGSGTEIAQIIGTGTLNVMSGPSGYLNWANTNAPGQNPELDHDNDGALNGVEYFMGESGNSFTANPAPSSTAVTWPMGATYSGTYGVNYEIQTSSDLVIWNDASVGVGPNTVQIVPGTSVTYTLPTGAGPNFVRLAVYPE